jgi:hypothetical protein
VNNKEEEEDEDQRLTDEQIERGLKIYYEDDREQYRAAWSGKITGEDIISKIIVDEEQMFENIIEEGKAKGLNKKQTDLLHADKSLERFNDQLLAMRTVYQLVRNRKFANRSPMTNEIEKLQVKEALEAIKEAIKDIKESIKTVEGIRREIEEGKEKE